MIADVGAPGMLSPRGSTEPLIDLTRGERVQDMLRTPSRYFLFLSILTACGIVALGSPASRAGGNQQLDKDRGEMVRLKIDHVTIVGSSLDRLRDAFEEIGLTTEYGGAHSNGVTHMALLGFDDGSYIELASTVKPGDTNVSVWKKQMLGDGGPAGWAVSTTDAAAESKRLAGLGVSVQGPFPGGRKRPDGIQASWKLLFVGNQPIGAVLPFYIEDVTPRTNRVKPSASVSKTELTGVAAVVIAVHDLDAAVKQFRSLYHWGEPRIETDDAFGARLAHFPDSPVVLATPDSRKNWLADRLARFGESPAAILIHSKDLPASLQRFDLTTEHSWFGRHVAWFDPSRTAGTRLGLIE